MAPKDMDIFNWYVVGNSIRGDICVRKYRHDSFVVEKMAYRSPDYIAKRDQEDKSRYLVYVQDKIVRYCPDEQYVETPQGMKYVLRNMDAYFLARKDEQYACLRTFVDKQGTISKK